MANDSEKEDYVSMEYELPVSADGAPNHFAPHRHLFDFLKLDLKDAVLVKIFRIFAGLCDPMTQPEDTDSLPLSVDLLAQLSIALSYEVVLQGRREDKTRPWQTGEQAELAVDIETIRFAISTKFHLIVLAINKLIRADDELRVRYLQNDWKDWRQTAPFWLPRLGHENFELLIKLAYYICPVAIMGLYRLFLPVEGAQYNASLNPYLETFIRLWKTHTDIVALALEMDRELEEEAWTNKNETIDTPDLVKRALLGSSATRTVLAWILERTQSSSRDSIVGSLLDDDLQQKPLLSFYDPLARSAPNCGSISYDQHLLVVAILLLRCHSAYSPCWQDAAYLENIPFPSFDSGDLLRRVNRRLDPLQATGDLMVDMYYRDQFDEDVRYVFGYYDSDEENQSDKSSNTDSLARRGIAVRATGDEQQFDEEGRDWRDCPRGENVKFTTDFLDLEEQVLQVPNNDYFFASWFELNQALEFLAFTPIESVDSFMIRVGQVAIDSIAKAVKDENTHKDSKIVIKEIYRYLVSPAKQELLMRVEEDFTLLPTHPVTHFEVILLRNPYCALAILDELFMCNGLRRSLIWFLTNHVNPLMALISYMYEFVAGLRGNSAKREAKYSFSRKGAVEISKMEQLMMLHELFSAADKWLSDEDESTMIGELNCMRLISYLCLMIKKLLLDGIIQPNQADVYEDYSHEIQLLLFNWIGKVPEAREIFFKIKQGRFGITEKTPEDGQINDPDTDKEHKIPLKAQNGDFSSERRRDNETVSNFLLHVNALKDLDESAYAVKCREPSTNEAFIDFANIIADHVYEIYMRRELIHKQSTQYQGPTTEESIDVQHFFKYFGVLHKSQVFVDQLVTRLAGWIVDTRCEKIEIEGDANELLVDTMDVEEYGKHEVADSEFSEAFLNAEEPFHGLERKNITMKKKAKKKRRGN